MKMFSNNKFTWVEQGVNNYIVAARPARGVGRADGSITVAYIKTSHKALNL